MHAYFIAGDNDEISNFSIENQTMSSLSPQADAAIFLPASLFEQIAEEKDNISIFFIHYLNSTLFPVGGVNTDTSLIRRREVGSTILAATVGLSSKIKDLEEDMNITAFFRLKISEDQVDLYCN